MKTPKEIKKGLSVYTPEEIKEILQQKWTIHSSEKLYRSALTYIQQLEAQNAELVRETDKLQSSMDQVQKALQDNGFQTLEELLQAYSQVKRERDAGVRWVFNEEDAKNYKIPENVLTKQQMENLYLVGSDGKRSKMFSKGHSSKGKEGGNDV